MLCAFQTLTWRIALSLWWVDNNGNNLLKGEPAFIAQDGTALKTEILAERYFMLTGLSYSPWTDSRGNSPDPDNPIRIGDAFILECLQTVKKAVADFWTILPTLNSAEQDRLNALLARAPFALIPVPDTLDSNDQFTNRLSNQVVRTAGPRGGTRIGG